MEQHTKFSMRIMDRIIRDLHLGKRSVVAIAYAGLRRRGYIVLGDATSATLYWVNGNRLTTFQLMALAIKRGVRLRRR
jgi:hypothetical protein